MYSYFSFFFFFFNDTATTEIYTLSLHDALPISGRRCLGRRAKRASQAFPGLCRHRNWCSPRTSYANLPRQVPKLAPRSFMSVFVPSLQGAISPARHSTAAPPPNRVWRTLRSGPLPFRELRISSSTAAAAPSSAAPIFASLLHCFGTWDSRTFGCWSYTPASPLTGQAKLRHRKRIELIFGGTFARSPNLALLCPCCYAFPD